MKPGLDLDKLLGGDDEAPMTKESFTSETAPKPQTTIGQVDIPATGIFNKNRNTEQHKKERQFLHLLDPNVCRPWRYHDRMEEALTVERCGELIESIIKEGQLEPVVVRKLHDDPDFEFEIIYGRRRHFSCQYIKANRDPGFVLKAVVREVGDDQEAAFLTWVENEGQAPISDFERAVYFRRLLGKMAGYPAVFNSQDALREKFELDKGKMSKLVKCGELIEYDEIMGIIPDRTEIPFTYGHKLAVALDDAHTKNKIIAHVKKLKGQGRALSTNQVIKALLNCISANEKVPPKTLRFKDRKDNVVLSCETKTNGVVQIKLDPLAAEISRKELSSLFNKMLDEIYAKA